MACVILLNIAFQISLEWHVLYGIVWRIAFNTVCCAVILYSTIYRPILVYCIVLYCITLYYTVLRYSAAMHCIIVLCCVIVLLSTAPYCIALYCCIVLHCIISLYCIVWLYYIAGVLYFILFYCTVLSFIVLYCNVLCCTVMYCIVLYFNVLYCTSTSRVTSTGNEFCTLWLCVRAFVRNVWSSQKPEIKWPKINQNRLSKPSTTSTWALQGAIINPAVSPTLWHIH